MSPHNRLPGDLSTFLQPSSVTSGISTFKFRAECVDLGTEDAVTINITQDEVCEYCPSFPLGSSHDCGRAKPRGDFRSASSVCSELIAFSAPDFL